MAQPGASTTAPRQQEVPRRPPGLLSNVFWHWPWQLVGMLLVSLIFSLIVEYVGIAFFWPEEGALHNKAVMETESRYFSEEFTRSLLLSDPVVTVECWLTLAYQWLFVDSGFLGWLNAPTQIKATTLPGR